jgi:UDP-glucose 4-epimerase
VNILLTGGAGYIGSHTAVVLSEAGHEVVIYDNFCNSDRSVLIRLEKILGKPLTCIEGDIRDIDLLEKTFEQYHIEAVIHFAGLKAVGESVADPLKYYDNNVVGSLRLLEAMTNNGIRKLVFSSSATVYGDPEYLPIDENHPIHPTNPYGQTKAQIEKILEDLVRSNSDWRVVCLRYFNPVGAHDSGFIGENPRGIPNNLVPYMAQVAAGRLEKLRVFGDDYNTPDGTGVRDYIHVVDLAEGHLAALNYIVEHPGWFAINLGTGKGCSVLELLNTYRKICGYNINHEITSRRPGDVAVSYADVTRANLLLGWSHQRDINNMCVSSWGFQKKI